MKKNETGETGDQHVYEKATKITATRRYQTNRNG